MNEELASLYQADQQERVGQPGVNTLESKAMRIRDLQRRERVTAIAESNGLRSAEDYYHAAQIMNHGDTIADARRAHTFALRSSELGYRPARWLSAASYDRWQMYQGKPQKYGTSYIYDGRKDRLWDVDPETTDEERAAWDIPPLAKQLRKAEEANRHRVPMSDEEQKEFESNAPDWLKAILKHWREEQNNLE